MTGTSVRIIHSGLLPEWMKASMIFNRLASFLRLQFRGGLGDLDLELLRDPGKVHVGRRGRGRGRGAAGSGGGE